MSAHQIQSIAHHRNTSSCSSSALDRRSSPVGDARSAPCSNSSSSQTKKIVPLQGLGSASLPLRPLRWLVGSLDGATPNALVQRPPKKIDFIPWRAPKRRLLPYRLPQESYDMNPQETFAATHFTDPPRISQTDDRHAELQKDLCCILLGHVQPSEMAYKQRGLVWKIFLAKEILSFALVSWLV